MVRDRSRLLGGILLALVVVLGCAVLWLAVVSHLSHGLTALYRTTIDDKVVPIAKLVEHRPQFYSHQRALSRYIQEWPFGKRDIPRGLPALDVTLTGTIDIPEGPPRYLKTVGRGAILITRPKKKPLKQPLAEGLHPIELHWTGSFPVTPEGVEPTMVLTWATKGRPFVPVPRTAFAPERPADAGLFVLSFAAIALGGLFLASLAFLSRASGSSVVRRRAAIVLVSSALLLLGGSYRVYDYTAVPDFRASYDELFATWNGWSLLHGDEPRGWSLWAPVYGNMVDYEELYYFRTDPFIVIQPYFEHPPGMHLLVGAAATLGGAGNWAHARLKHTRIVPIALSMLSLLMVIVIGRRLDPDGPSPYFAGLLYASLPMIVLSSRMIKEEALLVLLSLLCIWQFLKYRDGGQRLGHLVMAAVFAGMTVWAKMPGALFLVALIVLVYPVAGFRRALLVGLIGAAVASLVLIYGAAIDWSTFIFTTGYQASSRTTTFNIFLRFFDFALIADNRIGRGWQLFLWLAFLLSLRRRDGDPAIYVPLVIYLTGMAVSAGNWTYGWYWLPLYPFLCLGAGRFLTQTIRQPDILGGAVVALVLVMYTLNFTVPTEFLSKPENWALIRRAVTIATVVLFGPFVLVELARNRFTELTARLALVVGLAIVVVQSGEFIFNYDIYSASYLDFDFTKHFSP